MNFLGWLAGTVFSKMICPGTFALSPGSPFPFFLSSMPLPSLLAHPPLMQGATFLSQHSHFCLTGHPSRGAPTHHSLTPFSILATGAVPGGSSLCPTLVYQKSGPFSQPWMSKSMHLDQATALGAKQSGMHDELWNPFPDKFKISGSARALDQWMGTCVTNQKILLGKCLGGEICSLLLWQTEAPMKALQGVTWKQATSPLCFKFRDCLRLS